MNDIEQQFFEVFGIEAKEYCKHFKYTRSLCDKINESRCQDCIGKYTDYPEITAEKLLKLIVIVTNQVNEISEMEDVEDLKKSTLEELIEISDRGNIKQQVRSLFEEGE